MKDQIESVISIFIRPPQDVSSQIVEVKSVSGLSYPDHEDSLPHATLYSSKFDDRKYPELLRQLEAMNAEAFDVALGGLVLKKMPERNYIFCSLNFQDKTPLQQLHEKVLGITNPLRGDLIRQKDIERFQNGKMSPEGWLATQKYGFQYFMERYDPHITIGVLPMGNESRAEELKDQLKQLEGKAFNIDRMYVKLSTWTLPEQARVAESEITEIAFK